MTVLATIPNGASYKDFRETVNFMRDRILTDPVSGVIVNVADSIGVGAFTNGYSALNNLGLVAGVQVTNQGPYAVSGHQVAGSYGIQADFGGDLSGFYNKRRPCVAVFQRGTNDLVVAGTSATALYASIQSFIQSFQDQGFFVPQCTLLPRAGQSAQVENYRLAFNDLVRANTAGADLVIDLASDPIMGPLAAASNTTYYLDGTHPTNAGQDLLAPHYLRAMRRLLQRTPKLLGVASGSAGAGSYVGGPLVMANDTYASGGFGQQLTGGYGSAQPVNGVPTSTTWSVECFATFGAAGTTGSPEVVMSQDWRFALAMDAAGRLQAMVASADHNPQFFGGGAYGGGGTLPMVANTGRRHLRISCSPSQQTLELDGQLLGTLAADVGSVNGSVPLRVRAHGTGYFSDPGGFVFSGPVDEAAIFNIFRKGVVVPTAAYSSATAGIVQLWHLDGSGAAA